MNRRDEEKKLAPKSPVLTDQEKLDAINAGIIKAKGIPIKKLSDLEKDPNYKKGLAEIMQKFEAQQASQNPYKNEPQALTELLTNGFEKIQHQKVIQSVPNKFPGYLKPTLEFPKNNPPQNQKDQNKGNGFLSQLSTALSEGFAAGAKAAGVPQIPTNAGAKIAEFAKANKEARKDEGKNIDKKAFAAPDKKEEKSLMPQSWITAAAKAAEAKAENKQEAPPPTQAHGKK